MPSPARTLSYPVAVQLAAEALAARDRLLDHQAVTGIDVAQFIFSVGTPGQGDGQRSVHIEVGAINIVITMDGEYTVLKVPIDMVRDAATQWDTPGCREVRTINPEV